MVTVRRVRASRNDGLSRRELIRGAAAAGAAAWTAPIIVGSIASPAAAGTPFVCTNTYWASISGSSTVGLLTGCGENCSVAHPSGSQCGNSAGATLPELKSHNANVLKVEFPAGSKVLKVVVHYGNVSENSGGDCDGGKGCIDANGNCKSGNECFEVPIQNVCASAPATTCGCISSDGRTVYFTSKGYSNVQVVWCV